MKKLLAAILVVALCSPAIADVAVTTDVSTAGEATITLTANGDTTELVGVAITVDSTAAIDDVIIDGGAVDSFFDIFVDAAFTAGAGYELGDGTAIALQDAPGETTLAANGTSFSVSIAGLDDDGIGAGTDEAPTSVTITLKCAGGATVDLGIDTLRGGVVSYAGAETVTGLPVQIVIDGGTETCADQFTGDEAALYARYKGEGNEPLAWCWQYQCYGDADNAEEDVFIEGLYRIYDNDLTLLINNWKGTPESGANPACDFDHMEEEVFIEGFYAIYDGDLTKLINNWKATSGELDDCPNYLAAP